MSLSHSKQPREKRDDPKAAPNFVILLSNWAFDRKSIYWLIKAPTPDGWIVWCDWVSSSFIFITSCKAPSRDQLIIQTHRQDNLSRGIKFPFPHVISFYRRKNPVKRKYLSHKITRRDSLGCQMKHICSVIGCIISYQSWDWDCRAGLAQTSQFCIPFHYPWYDWYGMGGNINFIGNTQLCSQTIYWIDS